MFIEKFSTLVSNNYFIVFMVLLLFDYITGVAKVLFGKLQTLMQVSKVLLNIQSYLLA
mgnify:CR=1 FL=1